MKRLLSAELIVDGRVPSEVAVSPDGRWVAYVVSAVGWAGAGPVRELWAAAAGGDDAPRMLASGDVRVPRWATDSRTVCFLAAGQLCRAGLDGRPAEVITSWVGGVSGHLPLVDPDVVALVAPDQPSAEDERRVRDGDDARVWGVGVRPDRLRLLDLRTGEVTTPGGVGDRHVVEVAQRPDGGSFAVLSQATPEVDTAPVLHEVDLDGVRELGVAAAGAHSLAWWAGDDGWHLAYVGKPELVGGNAVLDVGPGGERRNLTAGSAFCPVSLVQVDGGAPLMLMADGLDSAVHRLGVGVVETLAGQAKWLSADRRGGRFAVVRSTAYEPENVYTGEALTEAAGMWLTDLRPELRDVEWGRQERLSYRSRDGLDLDGLLILPPGRTRADGPFPMVIVAHGGPYDRHADRLMLGWDPSGQWLAAAGYAVFLPNPRGGRGHGHDFAVRAAGAVGLGEWTDILDGIDLLVAEGVADPGRLGIAGWSHGGFLAAWAVTQSDRFRAAVTGAGISDWGMLAATGEEGPFEAALGGSAGWEGVGPHPHDRLSPISYASKICTPLLILHGEDDTNVPVSQGEFLHRALRAFGVEHGFVVYPREGHRIRERRHQIDLLHRVRDWFERLC